MSIEAAGNIVASAAGSPVAQTAGRGAARIALAAATRARRVESSDPAERSEDRDADGRQPRESPSEQRDRETESPAPNAPGPRADERGEYFDGVG